MTWQYQGDGAARPMTQADFIRDINWIHKNAPTPYGFGVTKRELAREIGISSVYLHKLISQAHYIPSTSVKQGIYRTIMKYASPEMRAYYDGEPAVETVVTVPSGGPYDDIIAAAHARGYEAIIIRPAH